MSQISYIDALHFEIPCEGDGMVEADVSRLEETDCHIEVRWPLDQRDDLHRALQEAGFTIDSSGGEHYADAYPDRAILDAYGWMLELLGGDGMQLVQWSLCAPGGIDQTTLIASEEEGKGPTHLLILRNHPSFTPSDTPTTEFVAALAADGEHCTSAELLPKQEAIRVALTTAASTNLPRTLNRFYGLYLKGMVKEK